MTKTGSPCFVQSYLEWHFMKSSIAIVSTDPMLTELIRSTTGTLPDVYSCVESLLESPALNQLSTLGVDLRTRDNTVISPGVAVDLRSRIPAHVRVTVFTAGGMPVEQARSAVLFADQEWDLLEDVPPTSRFLEPLAQASRPGLYSINATARNIITTFSTSYFHVLQRMKLIAQLSIPVLITGETGTGKSTTARYLHSWSDRAADPFMILACGAVPGELLESDLFGHTRGAFTSANQHRTGRLEAVANGSLLLDEVDLLQLEQQAKLLRAVETGEFEPVGSVETRKTKARFIFASNVDLLSAVSQQRFRTDLYYRINVFDLALPPLRERREDIPMLAVNCLDEASPQFGPKKLSVSLEFLNGLRGYAWPGNIRELKNRIVRAAILSPTGRLRLEDLGSEAPVLPTVHLGEVPTLRQDRRAWERASIERVLRDNRQNRTAAAKSLGISRATLYKKMNEYGVT